MELEKIALEELDFRKRGGLLPVVVQKYDTKDVVMLAYANIAAVQETIRTRMAVFWSTSRNELWYKGRTSGDTIAVRQILVDCDGDALIYLANPAAGVCHTKDNDGNSRSSCFYKGLM